jgi:hypothetical protein
MSHDLATATRVLATNCCVCGRDLCDAKSVELGIGPVCRKRYFRDADIPLGPKGWQKALGVLVQSDLPEHIINSVLDERPDTRKAANIVVYWASAHHTIRAIVLACSAVVRFLGYTLLADKLERDRADLRFETVGDNIEIFCRRHDRFTSGLRRLGARMERHDSQRFRCWSVPASRKAALVVLAGFYFGGLQCFADGGIFTIDPVEDFEQFLALCPTPKATRPTTPAPSVKLYEQGGKLCVETPYNAAFVAAVRNVRGRRWNGQANTFPLKRRADVEALIQTHYGVTP